jgi:[ribosomal protein S5]-alanine N-acetyltransferase
MTAIRKLRTVGKTCAPNSREQDRTRRENLDRAVKIFSRRFLLRELTENDVTERYLSWLSDAAAKRFIVAAANTKSLSDLKRYVQKRIGREDILFLGIFEKATGLHIGNIKYEPVNTNSGYAVMGILIGDPDSRGRGVAAEVLRTSALWLREHRRIKRILLGVNQNNATAIKAYEKVGFIQSPSAFIQTEFPGNTAMIWDLSRLKAASADDRII